MSCPDWKTLAAWRDDPRADEPAEWQEALHHFDQGCARCRRAACASDPTLVFRRLRAVPAQTPVQESSEVDAMRRAVAAMQAASRVEASERHSRAALRMRWKHWGVAAALALAALSLPTGPSVRRDPVMAASRPAIQGTAVPAVLTDRSGLMAVAALPGINPGDDLPTLEGVDNRPEARVYHMGGDELAVTMIFDETLDV